MTARVVLALIIAIFLGGVGGWYIGSSGQIKYPQSQSMTQTAAIPAASTVSTKQLDFKLAMNKLWEDHITWTRLYLVDFASGNTMLASADATRLLKNQEDIGNAIKPYYGNDAGNKLTSLLKDHITGAVALVKAAKANDTASMDKANTDWYNNANQIADFIASANPKLAQTDLRAMMKSHLDLTKQEAIDILGKKYDASVTDFDNVNDEILKMSDTLSDGIIQQFPSKF